MITYKVWIEIEKYNDKTEQGEQIDACGFSSTAEFDELTDAIAFAERLNYTGEQLEKEYAP